MPGMILAEVKGRTFKGGSFAGLGGLDCWTTAEDVEALLKWEELFRGQHACCRSMFVFAFRLEQADVDSDGLEIFTCDDRRYVFFALEAAAYHKRCRRRSPQWRTVTLCADDFRSIAVPLREFIETARV
jgi:hypothetical protein